MGHVKLQCTKKKQKWCSTIWKYYQMLVVLIRKGPRKFLLCTEDQNSFCVEMKVIILIFNIAWCLCYSLFIYLH